jgi:hypothetical protein
MACSFWYTLHNKTIESFVNNELEMDEPEVVMALFQILKKTTENFS